jgi:hypothetical protein
VNESAAHHLFAIRPLHRGNYFSRSDITQCRSFAAHATYAAVTRIDIAPIARMEVVLTMLKPRPTTPAPSFGGAKPFAGVTSVQFGDQKHDYFRYWGKDKMLLKCNTPFFAIRAVTVYHAKFSPRNIKAEQA